MVGREGLDRQTLLDVCRHAGGTDARSHLTTGNLSFDADPVELDEVTRRLEAGVSSVIDRPEMVAVRTLTWLSGLLASDPFQSFDPAEWGLEVAFLRHDAPSIAVPRFGDLHQTVVVAVLDREVLAARPQGRGRRPHVNKLTERATGHRSTSRGWTTLRRIVAAH